MTVEQASPELTIGFDYKPELKGKTRTATLCGRVKIEGCKYKIQNRKEIPIVADQDTGISGKETSANISLTY